jgi:NTE family protein
MQDSLEKLSLNNLSLNNLSNIKAIKEHEIKSELQELLNTTNITLDEKYDIPIYDHNYSKKKFKKILVLSGGGIRGIAHIGAIHAFLKLNYLDKFQEFACSSIGSFLIALYLVGYTPIEIFELIKKIDITKLNNINLLDIVKSFGIDNGSNLEYLIKRLIHSKNVDSEITLKDLFLKTNKKLVITATCLNTLTVEYLSHENYPNLPLFKAVLMSCSIPWFYKPISLNNKLYVDGGCMDNYPIKLYDDRLEDVIGIYIIGGDNITDSIDNLETYSYKVFQCLNKGYDSYSKKTFRNYTIDIILDDEINILNFNLSPKQKLDMFMSGYNSIMNKFVNL